MPCLILEIWYSCSSRTACCGVGCMCLAFVPTCAFDATLNELATVRALRRLALLEEYQIQRLFSMRLIEMLACVSGHRVLLSVAFHREWGQETDTETTLAPTSPCCPRKLRGLRNSSIRSEMVATSGVKCADKHIDTTSLTLPSTY